MKVLQTIRLDRLPENAGKTKHIRSGEDVSRRITEVRLASLDNDPGIYIFYYDSDGNELNDLYFDSIEGARKHLEFEFGLDATA